VLQWRNSRPRRARSALGRSRQRTPSSSASGFSAISIVVGLVFWAPRNAHSSSSTVETTLLLSAFVAQVGSTCVKSPHLIRSASVHTGARGATQTWPTASGRTSTAARCFQWWSDAGRTRRVRRRETWWSKATNWAMLRTCCCERRKLRSTRSARPCASRRTAALADQQRVLPMELQVRRWDYERGGTMSRTDPTALTDALFAQRSLARWAVEAACPPRRVQRTSPRSSSARDVARSWLPPPALSRTESSRREGGRTSSCSATRLTSPFESAPTAHRSRRSIHRRQEPQDPRCSVTRQATVPDLAVDEKTERFLVDHRGPNRFALRPRRRWDRANVARLRSMASRLARTDSMLARQGRRPVTRRRAPSTASWSRTGAWSDSVTHAAPRVDGRWEQRPNHQGLDARRRQPVRPGCRQPERSTKRPPTRER